MLSLMARNEIPNDAIAPRANTTSVPTRFIPFIYYIYMKILHKGRIEYMEILHPERI